MQDILEWVIVRIAAPLGRRLGARRYARGAPRALWCGAPILTLPLKAEATRLLGFKSTSVVFETYYITRAFDLNLRKLANGAARLGPRAGRTMDRLILIWAMLRFDVFHYFFDRGLMRPQGRSGVDLQELEWLRAAGKRVYAFAYGADVRLRARTLALGRWNFCVDCPSPMTFCLCDDEKGRAQLDGICARITAPIALGDMLAYPPGARNLHYWPIDVAATQARRPDAIEKRNGGPLRIAHAPNHKHFKGSSYLEAAIETLRAEGAEIDYVKVQGVANTQVIRMFAEADIVADQFIGGAFGYTALEAMALGKPVMTFVRGADLVEAPHECPLINVTPDTLVEVLRWCVTHRDSLARIGAQGEAYVRRWHSVEAVAARFGDLYRETGDFPAAVLDDIAAHQAREEGRRRAIPSLSGWEHPFQVAGSACA